MKIHGLLIAAGASHRLGQPKQLVTYKGKTLINHAVDKLKSLDLDDCTVILGSQADLIKSKIDKEISILINADWQEGMGSTVRKGISSLDADVDAVLVLIVDQYKLTIDLLIQLINEFEKSEDHLVVSRYANGAFGPPAIFPKKYFNQLKELKGDRGAGKIIKSELEYNDQRVVIVDFEEGHLDVDTPQDLNHLNQ